MRLRSIVDGEFRSQIKFDEAIEINLQSEIYNPPFHA